MQKRETPHKDACIFEALPTAIGEALIFYLGTVN